MSREELSAHIRHLETEKVNLQRLVAELLLKNQTLREALAEERTRNAPTLSIRPIPW
jgi:hypothetical protein